MTQARIVRSQLPLEARGWALREHHEASWRPVVVERRGAQTQPPTAAVGARARRELIKHGSVLLRGFLLLGEQGFADVATALGLRVSTLPALVPWGRAAPACVCVGRNALQGLPTDRTQGRFAIADIRELERRLPSDLQAHLVARGVRYTRRFTARGSARSNWQHAFQTTDRALVEAWCRDKGLVLADVWGNALRIEYRGPVFAEHPKSREPRWVHAGPLFDFAVSRCDVAGECDHGLQVDYANGDRIERSVLAELHAVFTASASPVEWREDDALLLDRWSSWLHVSRSRRARLVFASST